ncbi:unnamed protein product [Symbiodinium natans]|uniref:Uncharacterized protein n=1 Tax=Symbiodinium natans TaxID=878477 RepID=A0A812PWQ1_9DINO|nr:unnamed protein product [Symbiodinium natans]
MQKTLGTASGDDGPARFRGAGVAINRAFESRMKQLQITGQRVAQVKPPNPNALKNRPSLLLDEAEIPHPTADQVVVIQPWFNLLAAAVWRDDRDVSMQDSIDEVNWSHSRISHELSAVRTPRTISRCLPRSPCDSRLDSASTDTRPPSSQVPLLPRPRRPESVEGTDAAVPAASVASVWPAGSARWRRLELLKPQTSPGRARSSAEQPREPRQEKPRGSDAFLGPLDFESDGEYELYEPPRSQPRSPAARGARRCWWQL